jgi:glycosyltransferase involved in cell wall biosynthesis
VNLLFVSRAYFPATRYGGPVIALRQMCTMLAAAGHQVTVVCTNMASPGRGGLRLPSGRFQMDNVRVHFLDARLRVRWEGWARGGLREISREMMQADVLHVTGTRHWLGAIAESAARRKNVPYLVQPEGSLPPRSRSLGAKRVLDGLHTRRSLAEAYRVIATSAAEARDLLDWGVRMEQLVVLPPRPDRIASSPRPALDLRAEWKIPPGSPLLLWMGRLHREKGLLTLLEALQDPRLRTACLLIAGDAEDRALLRRLGEWADLPVLRHRVRLLGWVGPREKGELLKLADLFVFPSRKENYGLAVAEAVTAGLPVVLTETCGIAPLIRDRAGLVCGPTANALAGTIVRALNDPALLERLRRGTAEVARELIGHPMVPRLEEIYRQAHWEHHGIRLPSTSPNGTTPRAADGHPGARSVDDDPVRAGPRPSRRPSMHQAE